MAYVHRASGADSKSELVTSESFANRPYTEQVWYTEPMKGWTGWTDPLKGSDTEDEPLVTFCLPLRDKSGERVGVIATDVSINQLSKIILAAKPSENGYSILLADNGSYIVHPDKEKLTASKVFSHKNRNVDTSEMEAAKAMIADGQYDETIPTTSQKDVLGKLQNCFAMMQQSLNKRMGTLQKNADEIKFLNEKLNNTKLQTEDIVRRKSLFIQQMTQQMRMPLNVIDMNRMLLLYDATETDATGALSRHRVDEVSCNKLSRECISHTHNHFPETDIRFESELQDTFCLLTNRFYLMGILRELLYNAVRYSYGKDVVLSLTQTDTTIRFTVQDLGPRLPANLPELTFKPFTMPEAGIGLSLVRRHAIALGGSMIIDTDYHEGCRIMIEMPK